MTQKPPDFSFFAILYQRHSSLALGIFCFNLGVSPIAFRLRLILEFRNSISPIVEFEVALLKFCL